MSSSNNKQKQISFSWLHLTDWHIREKQSEWVSSDILRDKFFKDLEKCLPVVGEKGLDFVFFTGDLVYGGQKEEFNKLDEELDAIFNKLKSLGSEPKLLVVPGNHDLIYSKAPTITKSVTVDWWKNEEIRNALWKANTLLESEDIVGIEIQKSFKNYLEWYQKQQEKGRIPKSMQEGFIPGDFSFIYEKQGLKIGIVGLNSAFLNLKEGFPYKGQLEINIRQFKSVCGSDVPKWTRECHLCLLLTHHPKTWLHEDDGEGAGDVDAQGKFEQAYEYFSLHLCGHNHETRLDQFEKCYIGTSFFGAPLTPRGGTRLHGYCLGMISVGVTNKKTKAIFIPRSAQKGKGVYEFVADTGYISLDKKECKTIKLKDANRELIPTIIQEQPIVSVENSSYNDVGKPKIRLNFKNRDAEKVEIEKHTLFVIDNPVGYGKTTFLEEILKIYTHKGWNGNFLNLGGSDKDFIEELISKLNLSDTKRLKDGLEDRVNDRTMTLITDLLMIESKRRGIILIFDDIEKILSNNKEIGNFTDNEDKDSVLLASNYPNLNRALALAQRCKKMAKDSMCEGKLKVIFAGRYITTGKYQNSISWKGFHRLKLKAFDKNTIQQILEDQKLEYKGTLVAERIRYLSGGHPAIIEKIVNYLIERRHGITTLFTNLTLEKDAFEECVKGELEENILKSVYSELVNVTSDKLLSKNILEGFEKLSVFRFFNLEIVGHILEVVNIVTDPITFVNQLNLIGLVTESSADEGFYYDHILRNLMFVKLKNENFEAFSGINEYAQAYFKQRLDSYAEEYKKYKRQLANKEIKLCQYLDGILRM
jgi:predicted MPP superfamily phosphohydrolase